MNAPEEHMNDMHEITRSPWKHFLIEAFQFVLIALLIIVPFRYFVAQPFIVNGASMAPTFHTGEYLIVDQISYYFQNPKRGSVVIFQYPNNTRKFFIKRIVGLPSETITIEDGAVTITNSDHPNGFALAEPYIKHHSNGALEVTLDTDEYFVLGDNRTGSSDSRRWGPLDEEFIIGRPIIRLLPPTEIALSPGRHEYNL